MSSTPALAAILQHTPPWVWGLLAALVATGLAQSVPRRVGLRRALLLPAAMLAWSLWSVASGFGSAVALAAWAVAAAFAAAAVVRGGDLAGARWSDREQRLHLPGSWTPLALILAIFVTRFGVGASLGLQPALRADAAFAVVVCLTYGTFSGVFAGRALALWRLATQGRARPAAPESAA